MAYQASLWSLMFVALATVVGVSFFVQVSSFTQMGARLTGRLQKVTFRGNRKRFTLYSALSWGVLCVSQLYRVQEIYGVVESSSVRVLTAPYDAFNFILWCDWWTICTGQPLSVKMWGGSTRKRTPRALSPHGWLPRQRSSRTSRDRTSAGERALMIPYWFTPLLPSF